MRVCNSIVFILLFITNPALSQGENEDPSFSESKHLAIEQVFVKFDKELEQLVFTIQVEGEAGSAQPKPVGQVDGAPVLGYVFPTTLEPIDVGFGATEGMVALALTSHPDFDDTPLWDENSDRDYQNDGLIWHAHWVVLTPNDRVPGGLAVKQFDPKDQSVKLPPTNPGMPMYMDSPGFSVITKGKRIKVIVPAYRINHKTKFNFDAVSAYMEVNTSRPDWPMLGVYKVFSVASGDLSLPYSVK